MIMTKWMMTNGTGKFRNNNIILPFCFLFANWKIWKFGNVYLIHWFKLIENKGIWKPLYLIHFAFSFHFQNCVKFENIFLIHFFIYSNWLMIILNFSKILVSWLMEFLRYTTEVWLLPCINLKSLKILFVKNSIF